MNQNPIACEIHDYLEIACMYKYKVKLHLKNRQSLEGKALDLVTENQLEYLVISDGSLRQLIPLTDLKKLQILTPNAQFHEVKF